MIIYIATNNVNGNQYVGQTIFSLEKRKRSHICAALNNKDGCYFHNTIRKYGEDSLKWEVLHKCNDIDLLNQLEIFYIGYYDTFENGYNLTLGGGGSIGHIPSAESRQKMSESGKGREFSAEHKRKISEAKKGVKCPVETIRKMSISAKNKPPISDETKRKMSMSRKGKKASVETRKKLSDRQRGTKNHMYGRYGKDNPHFGMKRSTKAKLKMSMARKGKYKGKNSPKAKAVIIDGKHFDTRNEAAEFAGVGAPCIRYRILHKTKWLDYSYK